MRIKGKVPSKPAPEVVVIPRGENGENDIVFHARFVDMSKFSEVVKRPTPPEKVAPGGVKSQDTDDMEYLTALRQYGEIRFAYMVIESLKETEDLVWETVTDDPTTWVNYQKELSEAGFTEIEINKVVQAVLNANSMNDQRYEEARDRFLRTRAEAAK